MTLTKVFCPDYVVPICLPRPESPGLLVGEPLTVAGWGKMNMTTEERATVLQYVQVGTVDGYRVDVCICMWPYP